MADDSSEPDSTDSSDSPDAVDDIDAIQRQMTATHDAASQFAARLVGLTQADAADLANADARFTLQFVAPGQPVTLDFRPNRIRATVTDGVVESATAG